MVEENPNTVGDERMFSTSGDQLTVQRVRWATPTGLSWCDVSSVNEDQTFSSTKAVQVEDSGAGNAWLIFGGAWGIRLKPVGSTEDWSLTSKTQWGLPFLVLDISAADIEF